MGIKNWGVFFLKDKKASDNRTFLSYIVRTLHSSTKYVG